jgi:DNA helicase-2/ATP-dependent DNA helicase PcrA
MDDSDFLRSLNPEQRTAAQHGSGPILVIAGAGTGKTKTLAARVAALIRSGAHPGRILLLTFTRRAAAEMIRRAGQVVGEAVANEVWGGTFHAIGHRLLRIHSSQLGLGKSFVVMDQADAQDLLNLIRAEMGFHRSPSRFPQKATLLAIYSRCINTGETLERVLTDYFPWCEDKIEDIKAIFRNYAERKGERELLDYDDLLLYWDQALYDATAGPAIAQRFEHVLVDEYQDTNPLQASVLKKMWAQMDWSHPHAAPSIMVVGDDAQSIYSFRGATVENILRFPDEFPGTTTVTLEQNYRSIPPILAASNAVMMAAKHRFAKNLWSQRDGEHKPRLVTCDDEVRQSSFIADRLLEKREEGTGLMKQAVLFRASHNSDALEVELSRRNIPFVKWGGLRFLEAAHVKDLLAFLRVLENRSDDLSWMRILQLLDGIGPGRARQAIEHLEANGDLSHGLRTWKAPTSAKKQVESLASLFEEIGQPNTQLGLGEEIERIRRFCVPIFEARYDQWTMRIRDLDQLELLASGSPSRASFLADLTLDPPQSTGDLAGPPILDEEYVVLSTIHSAKGCEWDVVYLIHAADGVIPSDMADGDAAYDEERRLLYVAMTRARDDLYITFPLRYYHRKHSLGDRHSYAQLTRFLPPEVFPMFERSGVPSAAESEKPEEHNAVRVTESVKAKLSRLWS